MYIHRSPKTSQPASQPANQPTNQVTKLAGASNTRARLPKGEQIFAFDMRPASPSESASASASSAQCPVTISSVPRVGFNASHPSSLLDRLLDVYPRAACLSACVGFKHCDAMQSGKTVVIVIVSHRERESKRAPRDVQEWTALRELGLGWIGVLYRHPRDGQ